MSTVIQNTSWSVSELMGFLSQSGSISKPKFQRKLRWSVLPTEKKTASMREFIDFLYANKNTVHPVSFGEKIVDGKKLYENIDGNNRINSIWRFMQTPFAIYPEYLDEPIEWLRNTLAPEYATPIAAFLATLTYDAISKFRRIGDIYENAPAIRELVDQMATPHLRTLENYLIAIQDKLLFGRREMFENVVKLNVNMFIGATSEELCSIFTSINKYSSSLSGSDLLASELHETVIHVANADYNHEIRKEIQLYYDDKNQGEILTGYEIRDINAFTMNAFDCMVGLQNYCHRIYPNAVESFDPDIVSIFFKLYKILYGELVSTVFTQDRMNAFIGMMVCACDVSAQLFESIFPKNVDESIFNKNVRMDSIRLRAVSNQFLLCAILGMIKKGHTNKQIVGKLKIPLAYHFILSSISANAGLRETDKLSCAPHYGGNGLHTRSCAYVNCPETVSDSITETQMRELIRIAILDSVQNKPHRKQKKRRGFNRVERILVSAYYNQRMSNAYLKDTYSVEHIIPFSCSWGEGIELDIERLGNLVPFLIDPNKGRGNRNISYYDETCKEFVSFLEMVPKKEVYDTIVTYENTNPVIRDPKQYEAFCEKNEAIYVEAFLCKRTYGSLTNPPSRLPQ